MSGCIGSIAHLLKNLFFFVSKKMVRDLRIYDYFFYGVRGTLFRWSVPRSDAALHIRVTAVKFCKAFKRHRRRIGAS